MDIFEAARLNNVIELERLLPESNIDTGDNRGATALIIAAYHNNKEAVELILKSNADPEIRDKMGNTALMGACFQGNIEAAWALLNSGAKPNMTNGNGATALTFAATFGHLSIVELLIEKGADMLWKDHFGKNPIDYSLVQENEACYELMVGKLHAQRQGI